MSKLLRRTIITSIVLALCISCTVSFSLAADVDNTPIDSVIQLEYEEYISSQKYYTALAKEGAVLIIHVGEDNEEAELERISSGRNGLPDTLQAGSMTRNYSPPVYRYNVNTSGRKDIDGDSTQGVGYLFTNYIYYGCTSYELYLYNNKSTPLAVGLVQEGQTSSFLNYTVPPESGVVRYVTKPAWYARFNVPCSVDGYVRKMVM